MQLPGNSSLQALERKIWLHYYNDYLRNHQVITEDEWRKMRRLIDEKSASTTNSSTLS